MSLKFSDLREFSPMQIARLKKEYEPLRGKTYQYLMQIN